MASKNMTVKELIRLLKEQPQHMEVWLSKDEEGNGYAPVPLKEAWSVLHIKPEKWGWSDGVAFPREDDSPVPSEYRKVFVLWPDA